MFGCIGRDGVWILRFQNGKRWLSPLIYVLWIISIAGVVIGSLQPGTELPVDFWNADKLAHLFAYLWLALLPALIVKSPKKIFPLSMALVLLGIILEIGQIYVPGRMFSLGDIGANAAGVFLGFSMGKRWPLRLWRALPVAE
jgi:VanZ family protein